MVESTEYIPVPGDVVWINFNPQTGREQAGRRPAVVLSPWEYNRGSRNLAVFCPITTKGGDNPFEVVVPEGVAVKGVILADQIKSMDWRQRNAEFLCALPDETVDEVLDIIGVLLQIL
ncbi:MAG: type II toxin-antitoxin system PemK/MazF family toxin [Candidatus Poribacteria bacterium]|nr:type II toxin-antitoxin system PemK/MazF family toxin [Candidatus Poribacteria bacterium]